MEMADSVQVSAKELSSVETRVFEKSKKKKKKRYSSKHVKRAAKFEDSALKGFGRIFRAGDDGVSEWVKQRNKAARKRKDGAQKDGFRIHAKAFAKAASQAAKAPKDLADGLPRVKRISRSAIFSFGGKSRPMGPIVGPLGFMIRRQLRKHFRPFPF